MGIYDLPLHDEKYGFAWGPLRVERIVSSVEQGWVSIHCRSKRAVLQLFCDRDGRMRGYLNGENLHLENCPKAYLDAVPNIMPVSEDSDPFA